MVAVPKNIFSDAAILNFISEVLFFIVAKKRSFRTESFGDRKKFLKGGNRKDFERETFSWKKGGKVVFFLKRSSLAFKS